MGYYEELLEIGKIREAMLDEESKVLFDAKVDYMIRQDSEKFYNVIDTLEKKWYCRELDKMIEKNGIDNIIIFGCGHDGKRTKRILEKCGYVPMYYCDSDNLKVGMFVDGLEVISVNSLVEEYGNSLVILGSAKYAEEMYDFLLQKKYPTDKILYSKYGTIVAQCGKQYFDMFSMRKDEVFIDAGGYNGNTMLEYVDWTAGEYKKIFVFEPMAEMVHLIKKKIKDRHISRVEVRQNALWNKREKLCFIEAEAGSHVGESGSNIIDGIDLDEVVNNEKVTFIKMDIEGSELNGLKGAKNTIINNKPRLAICIYHKPEDILEIPLYILGLVPEYKFYIRHYCSNMWETVLYAEV